VKVFTLKSTENYVSHVLIVHSNNFGDQVIYIERENLDGSREIIFTEVNHEGGHREISPAYVDSMRMKV
jgi:hypothetical protein